MEAFLMLIGLGFILWMISRGLRKVGKALERIGDHMLMNDSTPKAVRARARKDEAREKVHAVKGEDGDFMKKAREEIDELTETE